MSVILLILKIIGIILLIILGLLVLAILAVLFVPIRYRIKGAALENVTLHISVSWLLHIVSFRGRLENKEFTQTLRIFGIPLRLDKELKEAKPKKKAGPRKKAKAKPTLPAEPVKPTEPTLPTEKVKSAEPEQEKKTSWFDKIKKIKQFFRMLKAKMETLKEKAANIREIIARVKQEIQNETNRAAVAVLFRELKYLLGHIAPGKVTADISFGMEDPATTGQILGVISVLPFVYRYKLHICPDFEAEKFYYNGTFDMKGHIRGIHMIVVGFHLLKDKNIQSLIQRYRNL